MSRTRKHRPYWIKVRELVLKHQPPPIAQHSFGCDRGRRACTLPVEPVIDRHLFDSTFCRWEPPRQFYDAYFPSSSEQCGCCEMGEDRRARFAAASARRMKNRRYQDLLD